ncbi:threonine synthase [Flavihumibacter rivuli]|uniref:threonine synthase n=1 Tax=Flavihumibacter rivuli TaxID=2838156 RepID=UPI001BDF0D4A|nr:threonine synthase [Flavihumibacter rivuli]ULQ58145.1 threonine synthase [Flavihumibacter rivuli]
MKYYSLKHQSPDVDFREATISGQAPDGGLYFPRSVNSLNTDFIHNLKHTSDEAICYEVIRHYVGTCIPDQVLKDIVAETIDFPIPLTQVNDHIFSLELFHGPTLAFKDVGARFMSRCLGYFARSTNREVTVLVATSGDTGGAVASGFAGVPGVNVVILYPSGKVSKVQEQQLTTFGGNVKALEVKGNFDDCQQMVKKAFLDEALKAKLFLTSANSINVARWLPQQFYYFLALKQWREAAPPVICVPSGNFGNICAGMLAFRSGLPVSHFIAACNANDTVPHFMQTGKYEARKAVATISNAMDVGDPSNFIRILELFHDAKPDLHEILTSVSVTDEKTKEVIRQVYQQYQYLLDPHGAVAYAALDSYHSENPERKGIILETAHPIKFLDVVEPIIGSNIPVPESIRHIMDKPRHSTVISNHYEALQQELLQL